MNEPKDPILLQILVQAGSILYTTLTAALAGALRYLVALKAHWEDFSWKTFILAFIVGGFNGYLVYMLCQIAGLGWSATSFITGAAGALGNEFLAALANKAKSAILKDK